MYRTMCIESNFYGMKKKREKEFQTYAYVVGYTKDPWKDTDETGNIPSPFLGTQKDLGIPLTVAVTWIVRSKSQPEHLMTTSTFCRKRPLALQQLSLQTCA